MRLNYKMNNEAITKIAEIHTDMKWIKKELNGNGKPGLIQRVAENTNWRFKIIGALSLISAILGYVGFIK